MNLGPTEQKNMIGTNLSLFKRINNSKTFMIQMIHRKYPSEFTVRLPVKTLIPKSTELICVCFQAVCIQGLLPILWSTNFQCSLHMKWLPLSGEGVALNTTHLI